MKRLTVSAIKGLFDFLFSNGFMAIS